MLWEKYQYRHKELVFPNLIVFNFCTTYVLKATLCKAYLVSPTFLPKRKKHHLFAQNCIVKPLFWIIWFGVPVIKEQVNQVQPFRKLPRNADSVIFLCRSRSVKYIKTSSYMRGQVCKCDCLCFLSVFVGFFLSFFFLFSQLPVFSEKETWLSDVTYSQCSTAH